MAKADSKLRLQIDSSQKIHRLSRGAFRYSVTRVTNVTIGQAVGSGLVTKYRPGPSSKLTTLLLNVLLKSQMLISEIRQHFLLKKCESSHFFNKKYKRSVYLVIKL